MIIYDKFANGSFNVVKQRIGFKYQHYMQPEPWYDCAIIPWEPKPSQETYKITGMNQS